MEPIPQSRPGHPQQGGIQSGLPEPGQPQEQVVGTEMHPSPLARFKAAGPGTWATEKSHGTPKWTEACRRRGGNESGCGVREAARTCKAEFWSTETKPECAGQGLAQRSSTQNPEAVHS